MSTGVWGQLLISPSISEETLTGAEVLRIQECTERCVGDVGVWCQAECYCDVLDGWNEVDGRDGDAEGGTGGDGTWDGDAVDAGRAEGGEEGEGGGEEGLGTHGGWWKGVAWRGRRVDGVQERIQGMSSRFVAGQLTMAGFY